MLKMMQTFTKNIRADGSGDIVFTGTVPECTGGTYSLMKSGFYSIANVGEVESLLLKLAGKS